MTAAQLPVEPCAALTGLPLPNLPGSDTSTVTASEVAGSGCQVAIEITDASDPRGGQPGNIGIDVTLPETWNGNYMAEGNGVYCSPASFVTLASDQGLAAGYAISQDDCGHTYSTNALISPWVTNSNPPPTLNWNRIDDFGPDRGIQLHLQQQAPVHQPVPADRPGPAWLGAVGSGLAVARHSATDPVITKDRRRRRHRSFVITR